MVAVSAGDSLETVMAAYGSGAAARSIENAAPVMNVDVGGGTSKIAVCADGKVLDVTAVDVGARLVVLDSEGRIVRLEEAGRRFGAELGHEARTRISAAATIRRKRSPRAWPTDCLKRWRAARRAPAAPNCCGSTR